MADDTGKEYLRRLAKNNLGLNPALNKTMKKTSHSTPSMKNGSLNTKPDTPMANTLNKGNRQTFAKTPPGNMNAPRAMHRAKEDTKNYNKLRGVS